MQRERWRPPGPAGVASVHVSKLLPTNYGRHRGLLVEPAEHHSPVCIICVLRLEERTPAPHVPLGLKFEIWGVCGLCDGFTTTTTPSECVGEHTREEPELADSFVLLTVCFYSSDPVCIDVSNWAPEGIPDVPVAGTIESTPVPGRPGPCTCPDSAGENCTGGTFAWRGGCLSEEGTLPAPGFFPSLWSWLRCAREGCCRSALCQGAEEKGPCVCVCCGKPFGTSCGLLKTA